VTIVSCPPFCDENVAVILSSLINKHGQKGDRHLNKCGAHGSGFKRCKKQEAKTREEEVETKSRNIQVTIFAVAVKSSGDISAEPVRGQKIEEHVVTD